MTYSVTFNLPNYSLNQIKKDYYLYDLCVNDTSQLENIAITIQSLYFYQSILVSNDFSRSFEASLCRTIIIMSYSILEAIVISTGYKIQNYCKVCRHSCSYCSSSMFKDINTHNNEMRAFTRAADFLEKTKIISLTRPAKMYFDNFRDNRNNVHLARNSKVITEDQTYTRNECNSAIIFLQSIIKMIYNNYVEFCRKYKCGK